MAFSKGGSKSKTSGATGFDPQTQEWINQIYQSTMNATRNGGVPAGAGVGAVGDFYRGAMDQGRLGLDALAGDPTAIGSLFNPYVDQVIDRNAADWQRTNEATSTQMNAAAARAGAFGGARHGLATGTALARNNEAQMTQAAGLRQAGFSDAMQRASGLANLGFGAASGAFNVEDYLRSVAMQNTPMEILKRGLAGTPFGTTSRGTNSQSTWGISHNFFPAPL